MPSLRESAAAPSPGANLARLDELLDFVRPRLSAPGLAAAADPIRMSR
jgi:hypothetical protein